MEFILIRVTRRIEHAFCPDLNIWRLARYGLGISILHLEGSKSSPHQLRDQHHSRLANLSLSVV
jgi:hypothetical protein